MFLKLNISTTINIINEKIIIHLLFLTCLLHISKFLDLILYHQVFALRNKIITYITILIKL